MTPRSFPFVSASFVASNKRIIGTQVGALLGVLFTLQPAARSRVAPNSNQMNAPSLWKRYFLNDIRHPRPWHIVIGASFNQPAHYALHLTGQTTFDCCQKKKSLQTKIGFKEIIDVRQQILTSRHDFIIFGYENFLNGRSA